MCTYFHIVHPATETSPQTCHEYSFCCGYDFCRHKIEEHKGECTCEPTPDTEDYCRCTDD